MDYTSELKYLITNPIIVIEDPSSITSTTNKSLSTNYTLSVGITQYVAEGTQLSAFSVPFITAGYMNVDIKTNDTFNRLMNYMINNGLGTLSYFVNQYAILFYDCVNMNWNHLEYVYMVTLIVDPIIIIILLFLFIPFILQVQANLQRIYLHICQFNSADIKKWLDECNNSAIDIKASISRMQEIYIGETFEINPADYEKKVKEKEEHNKPKEEEKNVNADKNTDANIKLNEKTELKSNENANEEDPDGEATSLIDISKETSVSERKQSAFSQMSKDKTKSYIAYLVIFVIYIAAFKITDGVLLTYLDSGTQLKMSTLNLFYQRTWVQEKTRIFFHQNMVYNTITSYFDSMI